MPTHHTTIASPSAAPVIQLQGISKHYPAAGGSFTALNDLSLRIQRGEFVAIAGPSGSGKSSLLNLLGGIDRPSSGELFIDGHALHQFSEAQLSAWRGRHVGIVFQFFQLLPTLTAIENVMLPMDLCRQWPAAQRRQRAMALLQRLGIADQADKFPVALSGGQQQRVALARALANEPPLLLADEPTGNLDSHNARALLQILSALVRDQGLTVVMVTHEADARRQAQRTITLADGQIVRDSATDDPQDLHALHTAANTEPSHA